MPDQQLDQELDWYLRLVATLRANESLIENNLIGPLSNIIGVKSVHSRLKTWESVQEKVRRKRQNALHGFEVDDIADFYGVRIVVEDRAAAERAHDVVLSALHTLSQTAAEFDAIHGLPLIRMHLNGYLQLPAATGDVRCPAEFQILSPAAQTLGDHAHVAAYGGGAAYAALDLLPLQLERLNGIIAEFERILERPDVHEKRDVHPFLKKHSFLLHPNPDSILSEVPIGVGTQFRMDFLIRDASGRYLVVEIENPQRQLFTKAGNLTASVSHAVQQVEDWQEWIEDNLPSVQKLYPDMSSPSGMVVIGRTLGLPERDRRRLGRHNVNLGGRVRVVTYDDLLGAARAYVRSLMNTLRATT